MTFGERLQHAWDAFRNKDPTTFNPYGASYVGNNPDRPVLRLGNERTIISAIYTRIAMDVSTMDFQHVRVDENGRYVEEIHDGLDECLTVSANIDQSGRAFIFDTVMSLFDEGVVALVPVETEINSPIISGTYDIRQLRVGKIVDWFPEYVRINCYNQLNGTKQDIVLPKKAVAIVENPFYYVMNERNSIIRRVIRKMNQLDVVDDTTASGKLDLILQLPYETRTDMKRTQAEARRKDIETQLTGSKYGIAYVGATERIVQLNRPVENSFQSQIEYLMKLLYSQLGISEEVFSGTADDQVMNTYYNRTVEPVATAICDAMTRTFLTKTARTQGQVVKFHRDPFKLLAVSSVAETADKFTRNEILSPNDVRSIIGYKPSKDPRSDELRNRNLNADHDQLPNMVKSDTQSKEINSNN